jgi:hypothetical protein
VNQDDPPSHASTSSIIPSLTRIPLHTKPPTKTDIESLEQLGFASSDPGAGISFLGRGSFTYFDTQLRKLMPNAFAILDQQKKIPNPLFEDDQPELYRFFPSYMLATQEYKSIKIVPGHPFPDMKTVAEWKDHKLNSIILCKLIDCCIYLYPYATALRFAIPDNIRRYEFFCC